MNATTSKPGYSGYAVIERGNPAMVLARGIDEQEMIRVAAEHNSNPFNISSFEVVRVFVTYHLGTASTPRLTNTEGGKK